MGNLIISNVIDEKTLRAVQSKVMQEAANIISKSFGPYGSNTCIKPGDSLTRYTKDGFSILKAVKYNGIIEAAVLEDLVESTRYIAKDVGDGTTTTVIAAANLFTQLTQGEAAENSTPYDIMRAFASVTEKLKAAIREHGRDCTLQDIYNIAYTSTNGNDKIASNIAKIYEEYGTDVYIDLGISGSENDVLKVYDGMTVDAGYCDAAFINDSKKNTSTIRNPRIYFFEDPIDTPEMIALFNAVVIKNIMNPYLKENQGMGLTPIPTVIMTPKLSRDATSVMDQITNFMSSMTTLEDRPPLLIVSNLVNQDIMSDVSKMCGCKSIKKYLDPNIQKADIENGRAPIPDTVTEFYGTCDEVVADGDKTKFINPSLMWEDAEHTKHTNVYDSLVYYLEGEYKKLQDEKVSKLESYRTFRRLNSLKANLVEYLIGGITVADRDCDKDLAEDAIKSCRSAAQHGVGYGSNFETILAANKLYNRKETDLSDLENLIMGYIYYSYKDILKRLYCTKYSEDKASEVLGEALDKGRPINLRTDKFDDTVLTSIESDCAILDTISKIITKTATANQFILPTPAHNAYFNELD